VLLANVRTWGCHMADTGAIMACLSLDIPMVVMLVSADQPATPVAVPDSAWPESLDPPRMPERQAGPEVRV
jgi:hypothetical protein